MNLAKLKAGALLMRMSTAQGTDGCRIAVTDEVVWDARTTKMLEFAWFVGHGNWSVHPDRIVRTCDCPECIVHLGYEDDEDRAEQLYADRRPVRTIAQMFRTGINRGWFRIGGYSA